MTVDELRKAQFSKAVRRQLELSLRERRDKIAELSKLYSMRKSGMTLKQIGQKIGKSAGRVGVDISNYELLTTNNGPFFGLSIRAGNAIKNSFSYSSEQLCIEAMREMDLDDLCAILLRTDNCGKVTVLEIINHINHPMLHDDDKVDLHNL